VAEIKSTLELAMERTKKYSVSEKEKEEIKQKEILQKAQSLSSRYMAGYLPLNEVLREMEKMEEKIGRKIRELLLLQFIDGLSFEGEPDQLIKGIEALRGRSIDEEKQAFFGLLTQYRERKEKIEKEWRDKSLASLKKDGIFGSAVEPCLDENPLRTKEAKETEERFQPEMEKLKERLKKS